MYKMLNSQMFFIKKLTIPFSLVLSINASANPTLARILAKQKIAMLDKFNGRLQILKGGQSFISKTIKSNPHELAISSDRKIMAIAAPQYEDSADLGQVVELFDQFSGLRSEVRIPGARMVHGIDFLPEGHKFLVTSEGSSKVFLVSADSGKVLNSWDTKPHRCHMVRYIPKQSGFISTCRSTNTVIFVANMNLAKPKVYEWHELPAVEALAANPNGTIAWFGLKKSHEIARINLEDKTLTRSNVGHPLIRLILRKNHEVLAISSDGYFSRIKKTDLLVLFEQYLGNYKPTSLALSQDQEQALIGTEEGKLLTWQENNSEQFSHWQSPIVGIDGIIIW
ncbi:MAG: YncE family protein [Oligoflexales bacterium]